MYSYIKSGGLCWWK